MLARITFKRGRTTLTAKPPSAFVSGVTKPPLFEIPYRRRPGQCSIPRGGDHVTRMFRTTCHTPRTIDRGLLRGLARRTYYPRVF